MLNYLAMKLIKTLLIPNLRDFLLTSDYAVPEVFDCPDKN